MAPGQADGVVSAMVDRTDVYGLGAVLYHCLTGRPPFQGGSTLAVLAKVMEEPLVAPRKLRPEVPPALEAVCLRALAKRPDRRHPSAAALAEELDGWEARTSTPAWALAALAGLVAAALLLAVGVFAVGQGAATDAAQAREDRPPTDGSSPGGSGEPGPRAGEEQPWDLGAELERSARLDPEVRAAHRAEWESWDARLEGLSDPLNARSLIDDAAIEVARLKDEGAGEEARWALLRHVLAGVASWLRREPEGAFTGAEASERILAGALRLLGLVAQHEGRRVAARGLFEAAGAKGEADAYGDLCALVEGRDPEAYRHYASLGAAAKTDRGLLNFGWSLLDGVGGPADPVAAADLVKAGPVAERLEAGCLFGLARARANPEDPAGRARLRESLAAGLAPGSDWRPKPMRRRQAISVFLASRELVDLRFADRLVASLQTEGVDTSDEAAAVAVALMKADVDGALQALWSPGLAGSPADGGLLGPQPELIIKRANLALDGLSEWTERRLDKWRRGPQGVPQPAAVWRARAVGWALGRKAVEEVGDAGAGVESLWKHLVRIYWAEGDLVRAGEALGRLRRSQVDKYRGWASLFQARLAFADGDLAGFRALAIESVEAGQRDGNLLLAAIYGCGVGGDRDGAKALAAVRAATNPDGTVQPRELSVLRACAFAANENEEEARRRLLEGSDEKPYGLLAPVALRAAELLRDSDDPSAKPLARSSENVSRPLACPRRRRLRWSKRTMNHIAGTSPASATPPMPARWARDPFSDGA
jgi:hypothetical protein